MASEGAAGSCQNCRRFRDLQDWLFGRFGEHLISKSLNETNLGTAGWFLGKPSQKVGVGGSRGALASETKPALSSPTVEVLARSCGPHCPFQECVLT